MIDEYDAIEEPEPSFVHEARVRADVGEIPTKTAFVEDFFDFLAGQGAIAEGSAVPLDFDKPSMRVDGYEFDRENGSLSLVVADFHDDDVPIPLVKGDIDRLFKKAETFLVQARSSSFRAKLEESSPEYRLVDLFQRALQDDRLDTIRIFLVSTRRFGARTAAGEYKRSEEIPGIRALLRYEVWDSERRRRAEGARFGKEDVEVDCTSSDPLGIPCLKADEGEASGGVQTFLAVLRGDFLADLYRDYSERLLEQNVRTFLQFKGGVNKGIRSTLTNEPEMFLAFNNGVTATADAVELDKEGSCILRIRNLQIVNGGQTTASLFNARRDYGANLSKVRIQMKLAVIPENRYDEAVPRIAQYANTQNAVNAADFAVNHPFQKRLQDLSRRISAPGAQYDWHWFYERTRGQYNNAIALAGSAKQQEMFKRRNPFKFDKTDAAKYALAWDMMPEVVSLGGQKCFVRFMEKMKGMWASTDGGADAPLPEDEFNEHFFKELVAKAIIFRRLDKLVMKQPWYAGFKANIVAYAVAAFRQMVEDRGLVYNLIAVWDRQDISKRMENCLLRIAQIVSERLHAEDPTLAGNPTERAKQSKFWQKIRLEGFEPGYDLAQECVDPAKRDRDIATACARQRAERSDKVVVESRGAAWWAMFAEWTRAHLSEYHAANESVLRKASSPDKIARLSRQECARLVRLERSAREAGFDV